MFGWPRGKPLSAQHKAKIRAANRRSPIERKVEAELIRLGIPFRAEVPIGRYRVDFLVRGKLVIECDGKKYHTKQEHRDYDAKRDRILTEQGYTVVRLTGSEIYRNVSKAVQRALGL
jgi:very-short-patch-repair endonuclease